MKIAFTTDTHLMLNSKWLTSENQIKSLRDNIQAENPDVIIHGGDIGEVREDLRNFTEVLQILGNTQNNLLIAGNHDLWTGPGTENKTSKELWNNTIPKMCLDYNWHYLEQNNWTKSGIAVVGSYLHYDYSSADPKGAIINYIKSNFPDWTPDKYYEKMKKRHINDAKFFKNLPKDKDFAKLIGDAFDKRLLEAQKNESIHTIIIVTHVPCMPCQITRKPKNFEWSCATAYFGNLSHVKTIMECSKIKYILSGHSHQGNRNTIKLNNGEAEVITLGSDYGKPLFEIIDIKSPKQ